MRSRIETVVCATVVLLSIWTGSSLGVIPTYSEDFSTTNLKDVTNTTADWNVAAGELKLYPFAPSLAGSYVSPGGGNDVFIAGNYAYLADGGFGLQVIDISDPTAPVLVGNYDTPGGAQDVYVVGNRAYVADAGAGLLIIDVTDRTAPVLLGSVNTSGTTYDVHVAGNIAYIADWASGLRAVDISDPTAPVIVGTYDTPGNCMGVDVSGNYAYVADNAQDLQVIDITDPTAPVLAASFAVSGFLRDLTVSGDWLYCAAGFAGLQVIDISDPAAPILVGSLNTADYAQDIQVSGNHVYVADRNGGLQIIDVTDPSVPVLELSYSGAGEAKGVWVGGEHAFVAAGSGGMLVIQVSTLTISASLGIYDTMGAFIQTSYAAGDHLFVANGTSGLLILDSSNPAALSFVATYPTLGYAVDVHVAGNYAFVIDDAYGLLVIDVSDPASPTLAGSYVTGDSMVSVFVSGDRAFLTTNTSLSALDISNPANPVFLGSVAIIGSWAESLYVVGDYALVGTAAGLQIFDINDPANPGLVGAYSTDRVYDLFVSGDVAFMAVGETGLLLIDIKDPSVPVRLSSYVSAGFTVGNVVGVCVSGDYAFVAVQGGTGGVDIVDIRDLNNPVLAGVTSPFDAWGVVVEGDHVYASGGLNSTTGVQTHQVFQNEVVASDNIGQSLAVDATNDPIVRTRVSATQSAGVTLEVSADAGGSWDSIAAGSGWNPLSAPGNELLWRSTLDWSPVVNPSISELQIDWLNDFALIASLNDIPNDQGKQVRVEWTRSGHDFVGDSLQIIEYAIYRKIDPTLSKPAATTPESFDALSPALRMNVTMQKSAGWDFVGTIPVRVEDDYAVVVPTLADSTITSGAYLSTFMVSALTATPGVFFDSPADSGYSVDNLAPSVPANLAVGYYTGNGNTLSWDASPDPDFQYFRVYRSTDPNFTPTPSELVHSTTSLGWVDPDNNGSTVSYKITATDFSGNESDVATPESVTAAPGAPVRGRWALHGNLPNPFNPVTQIRYSVPGGGGQMSLRVYDTRGQLVKTLVSGHAVAGDHTARWNGVDERGRAVASGIYFYRLEAGNYVQTRKMVLTK